MKKKMAFLGRRRPPIEKLHKIKVVGSPPNGGLDEVRSDLRGRLRLKWRSRLWLNQSLPKLACGAHFQWGVTWGGQIFFIGVPKMGAHFMPKNENWPMRGTGWGHLRPKSRSRLISFKIDLLASERSELRHDQPVWQVIIWLWPEKAQNYKIDLSASERSELRHNEVPVASCNLVFYCLISQLASEASSGTTSHGLEPWMASCYEWRVVIWSFTVGKSYPARWLILFDLLASEQSELKHDKLRVGAMSGRL